MSSDGQLVDTYQSILPDCLWQSRWLLPSYAMWTIYLSRKPKNDRRNVPENADMVSRQNLEFGLVRTLEVNTHSLRPHRGCSSGVIS